MARAASIAKPKSAKPARKKTAATDDAIGPFTGFPAGTLAFLTELGAMQDRDWFEANRERYEVDVRGPLASLVGSLTFAFAAHDIPLLGDPKKSVFRIHRDVRFSKDKRPYKSHASAVLTRDGSKGRQGLIYIHIDPAGSFVAGGVYMPDPYQLAAIRARIAERQREWLIVEDALAKAKLPFTTDLVAARLPKPFVVDEVADVAHALRLKSFEVSRPITPGQLASGDLIDRIVTLARDVRPLLDFSWAALAAMPRRPADHV